MVVPDVGVCPFTPLEWPNVFNLISLLINYEASTITSANSEHTNLKVIWVVPQIMRHVERKEWGWKGG